MQMVMYPIRHIRKNIFKLSQTDFAQLAGVTQSAVSNWENGGSLKSSEMSNIRFAARHLGISWKDEWFFETPEPAE